ncbi:MAG: hypothetical protein ACREUP_08620, partial [Burkholderiales bacterium]
GLLIVLTVSPLSLVMIACGVPAGTKKPAQGVVSKPGTVSPTGGRSGKTFDRLSDMTPIARRRPPYVSLARRPVHEHELNLAADEKA